MVESFCWLIMGYKFIDLFCGIGGFYLPFTKLGYKCVFSSDIHKFARQTYEANYGECPNSDITKISTADIPSHDLILAGIPCVSFSIAGKKAGFNDTRGTLFHEVARIAEHHKPKVVLLENVKNLLYHDDGNTLNVIVNTFENFGYRVSYNVYNARHFGVPQNRERIFIVAHNTDREFVFPPPPMLKSSVADILENCDVDVKYTLSDKLWSWMRERQDKHGWPYGMVDENSAYTPTLTARYYKDGKDILVKQDGKNPRRLTPRECARLQGFPESFVIPVSNTQAYKQFGNSVAIPVIECLAKAIDEQLFRT